MGDLRIIRGIGEGEGEGGIAGEREEGQLVCRVWMWTRLCRRWARLKFHRLVFMAKDWGGRLEDALGCCL